MSRRLFVKRSVQGALAAGAVWSAGTSNLLDRRRVRVTLPGPAGSLAGFRIAFASDFHCGPWTPAGEIRRAVDAMNAFAPDVVLLGGDYAVDDPACYRAAMEELSRLEAPGGVLAVPGNHEYWSSINMYHESLRETGIVDMTNRGRLAAGRKGAVWIAGLDDEWGGFARPAAAMEGAPEGTPRIVLTHNPNLADDLAPGYADLIVAGHTHGWQVYVPLLTRAVSPSELLTRYRAGFYRTAAGLMYVTRGVGVYYPHFRLWCRPEVTLFELACGG